MKKANKQMKEIIQNTLYKLWQHREKVEKNTADYECRNARLQGAIDLAGALSYVVDFNPIAKNENPFSVKERNAEVYNGKINNKRT